MSNIFIYLLQVTAGSALLYLCFILFYRNDTFYKRNRILLMLVMILPLVLPLFSIYKPETIRSESSVFIFADNLALAGQDFQSRLANGLSSLNLSFLVIFIWLSGLSVFLFRTVLSLVKTFSIIINGERINHGRLRVVISDQTHQPFSFWPYAVIPRDIYNSDGNREIISHEGYHIRQLHTIDLILSEIFLAAFWFNPVAWLLKKSIVLNHEYLADKNIIRETNSLKEYQYLLLKMASGLKPLYLKHNFNSNIKNRIVMINQKPTKRSAAIKNFILIPAIMLLFISFSFTAGKQEQQEKKSDSVFSVESQKKLMENIFMNISYPSEAKSNNLTGSFALIIKMKKGGIVDQIKVSDNDKDIRVPLLGSEVVVVGYGLKSPAAEKPVNSEAKDISILTREGIRVAGLLGSVNIPEWEAGALEFAITFKFILKYPEESTNILQLRDNQFPGSPDVIILVDGKEISREELKQIDPKSISTMSVLKGESATAVFGEKGKEGVIVITTKK